MTRRLLTLLIAFSAAVCSWAFSVADCFKSVPQSVFPLLDQTARLDLVDLFNSRLTAKTQNVYGGEAVLHELTADYLRLDCTEVSSWQLRLLPLAGDTLILSVHTLDAQGKASDVKLYNRHWAELKTPLPHPSASAFVKKECPLSYLRQQELLPVVASLPIQATASPSALTLTFTLSTEALPLETADDVRSMLHALTYEWQQGKFTLSAQQGQ